MTDEACFERHSQAVEYFEQGVSRFRECLECERWKGGSKVTTPRRITCWCCERINQSWKTTIDGHKVCGFCAKHLQGAMDAGLSPEMAKEEIKVVAQNMNPGKWPEKDLWSWAKDNVVDEKANASQQGTLADFQRVDIVSDAGYALLLPLTDREHVLLKWIETLAVEQRRTREQQILWMLEKAMDQEAAWHQL